MFFTKTFKEELPKDKPFILIDDEYIMTCESVKKSQYGNYEITICRTNTNSILRCYRGENTRWCYTDDMMKELMDDYD